MFNGSGYEGYKSSGFAAYDCSSMHNITYTIADRSPYAAITTVSVGVQVSVAANATDPVVLYIDSVTLAGVTGAPGPYTFDSALQGFSVNQYAGNPANAAIEWYTGS
jgi:hypothetical protein